MRTAFALATLLATSASGALAQSIQGVWKVVAINVDSGPQKGRHTTDVQPSLFIFAGHHYAMMFLTSFAARPMLSDSLTSEEQLAVFAPFVANAGTYTLKDSTLTFTPVVAKVPQVMSGQSFSWTVRIAGDSLWVDPALRLVRVE